jgi:arsenate reductase
MSKLTLMHNPRCSKSREALKILEENGIDAEIVKYLETPPTKEAIYKELNLKEVHDEEKLIEAMAEHPKLIERPIVIKDKKAVIGRPPSKIVDFLNA